MQACLTYLACLYTRHCLAGIALMLQMFEEGLKGLLFDMEEDHAAIRVRAPHAVDAAVQLACLPHKCLLSSDLSQIGWLGRCQRYKTHL